MSFAFLPIVTNVLIFYIIFEILVYIASYRLYKIEFPNFKNKLAPSFYVAIFMIYLTLSGVGFEILQIIIEGNNIAALQTSIENSATSVDPPLMEL